MAESSNLLYLEGIKAYLAADTARLNEILKSGELNTLEKRLLQARIFIKNHQFADANKELAFESEKAFLEAERNFLLANAAGYTANWDAAIKFNLTANALYKTCNYNRGIYLTSYNLSVDFSAVGLLQVAENYLIVAKGLARNETERSQILRALACTSCQLNQSTRAKKYLEQAFLLNEKLEPSEKSMLAAVAADIYFKLGDVDSAMNLLRELRFSKTIRDKGRVLLDVHLLEKLCYEKAPFSILSDEPEEVRLSNEYSTKWKIIRNLQHGDRKIAMQLWNHLASLFPQVYAADFICVDKSEDKSIFMTALRGILQTSISSQASEELLAKKSKLQTLIEALQQAGAPLRKEELIEKIWQRAYDPSYDARFYKLVERIRKEFKINIENKNQSYYIAS